MCREFNIVMTGSTDAKLVTGFKWFQILCSRWMANRQKKIQFCAHDVLCEGIWIHLPYPCVYFIVFHLR